MQHDEAPAEIRPEQYADIESQYRKLKELRKQLAVEQSKLLRQMPVSTKH